MTEENANFENDVLMLKIWKRIGHGESLGSRIQILYRVCSASIAQKCV